MEGGVAAHFEKGLVYSRVQIHEALGGNPRAALPTRGGQVVCVCLTREKNPRAPQEMVIGSGERAVRQARAFAASGVAVPVFVCAGRGGWRYVGQRRVRAVVEDPGALLSLVAEGAPLDVSLVLLLEEAASQSPSHGAEAAWPATSAPGA